MGNTLKGRICDKCREAVTEKTNSVRELEYRLLQQVVDPAMAYLMDMGTRFDRHLFPTKTCRGGVTISCVGSPSRAQYLGGVEDPRYPKDEGYEVKILKAWAEVKKSVEEVIP